MFAGHLCKGGDVGRVAGHRVDPVHAHQPRAAGRAAQQLLEVLRVFEAEALHRGASRPRRLAAVVDRLVRPRVEQDRARPGEHRDRGEVDVGDRRQHQRVRAAQQRREALLDLLVQHRAAQEARPARVRAPRVEVRRHRLDDLAVEVEPEVVAGGEVGQPLRPDADLAPVDLLDHGVHHRVRARQRRQVAQRRGGTLDGRFVPVRVALLCPFDDGSAAGRVSSCSAAGGHRCRAARPYSRAAAGRAAASRGRAPAAAARARSPGRARSGWPPASSTSPGPRCPRPRRGCRSSARAGSSPARSPRRPGRWSSARRTSGRS